MPPIVRPEMVVLLKETLGSELVSLKSGLGYNIVSTGLGDGVYL